MWCDVMYCVCSIQKEVLISMDFFHLDPLVELNHPNHKIYPNSAALMLNVSQQVCALFFPFFTILMFSYPFKIYTF